MKKQILLSALCVSGLISQAWAADSFSNEQKKQIEQVVHNYLVNHPEVLVETSQALQRKQQTEMEKLQKQAVDTIRTQTAAVFFNKSDPVAGNLKGTTTLVEFFDYQCAHCRDMVPTINELIQQDNQLRVVYKVFPIFGEASERAAKAALAAAKQDKFLAMHHALMQATDYSRDNILQLATKAGLELAKFKADLDSAAVQQEIKANIALAKQLKIYFTPVLIAANTQAKPKDMDIIFVPGQLSSQMLTQLIAQVRQGQ